MFKRLICIIAVVVMGIGLTACSKTSNLEQKNIKSVQENASAGQQVDNNVQQRTDSIENQAKSSYNKTIGINNSFVAPQGDEIYGFDRSVNGKNSLFKTNINDSKKILFENIRGNNGNIVISNDWIYFSDYEDEYLYKVKTDGTNKTKLCEDNSYCLFVVDDWVYYLNSISLYKIKTDGTERIGLTDNVVSIRKGRPYVMENWIYYINQEDDKFYKIKTDGTDNQKININIAGYFHTAINDWVFYINTENNDNIYKVKFDGSNPTQITKEGVVSFNILGEWIYYHDSSQYYLYKIKTDGSEKTQLNNEKSFSINVIGDWIFYVNGEGMICKIKTDGTSREEVKI